MPLKKWKKKNKGDEEIEKNLSLGNAEKEKKWSVNDNDDWSGKPILPFLRDCK